MEQKQDAQSGQTARQKRKNKRQQGFGGHGFKKIYNDKREKKRQRREEDERVARGEKPQNADYELIGYKIGSAKFDEYYKIQFKDIIKTDDEFETFKKTLYEKLPVTFRINPGLINFKEMVKMLKDPEFIKKNAVEVEENEGDGNQKDK